LVRDLSSEIIRSFLQLGDGLFHELEREIN